jgi:CheY-like chemotaxis protein
VSALESRVLVAQGPDGAPVRKQLRKALPEVDLMFVSNGQTALAELKAHPPDVVLIDAGFPEQDGYQVVKALRHYELRNVEVLFLHSPAEGDRYEPAEGSREDLPTVENRLRELLRERALRSSFAAAYDAVLHDASRGSSNLTQPELDALRAVDFPVDAEVDPAPAAERAARYDNIVRTSLTSEQAAKKLGVNQSRIRQRLLATPPQLYGIRYRNAWRLPAFQFGRSGLVPNIDKVVARLDPALDPVAVDTWFRTPNVDLAVGAEKAASPLQWLSQGRPHEFVADLAEDL